MNKKASSVLAILVCVFAVSCGDSNVPDANPVEDNEEAVVQEVEVIEGKIDQPEFVIPSALQISAMFKNSGLSYNNKGTILIIIQYNNDILYCQ